MSIWFDVSGLYDWQGNFTGIQRVVYNLGRALHEENPEAKFFIYRHGTFQPIGFDALEARLKAAREQAAQDNLRTPTARARLSPRKLLYYSLVFGKRAVRGSAIEAPLRRVYVSARGLYRSMRRRPMQPHIGSIFKAHDVVVVVDGNWQFAGFAESLAQAKKRTDFHLIHFVHDIVALRNPALVNKGGSKIIGEYFEKIFAIADRIITISDSTANDVRWFMAVNEHRPMVRKLILGDNIASAKKPKPQKPAAAIPREFVLAVSTIEIRKNYLALYYAYKLAQQQGVELPALVIVGRKGWMAEETYNLLTQDPEIADRIMVLEHVTDEQLEWLYQHCQFTVFPSFYEGWGIPIAESLAHGKVCVSSNTSSMPEVGGNLVKYASPYDPAAFMTTIDRLYHDRQERGKIEARIRRDYHPRSWAEAYKDFIAILG